MNLRRCCSSSTAQFISARSKKISRWITILTLLLLWKSTPHLASHHWPELDVLDDSGTSRGGEVYRAAMGDNRAKQTLKSSMHFTTRLLHVNPDRKRKIGLIISTLPEDEISSTTTIDDMSMIEISQQYLAQYPGDVTSELQGLIYEQMSNVWLNSVGVAPSGLTDGVAKFVRLRAGLAPEDQFQAENFNTSTRGPWEHGTYATAHFIDYL